MFCVRQQEIYLKVTALKVTISWIIPSKLLTLDTLKKFTPETKSYDLLKQLWAQYNIQCLWLVSEVQTLVEIHIELYSDDLCPHLHQIQIYLNYDNVMKSTSTMDV